MQAAAQELGLVGDANELCGDPAVVRMVQKEIETTGRKGGLKVHEGMGALAA